MNNNIILKIKKLLALSESSNENEAKIAMLRVQELLVKHKLSLEDIKETDIEEVNVVEHDTQIVYRQAKWKGMLAMIIANNFGCYAFCRTYRSNRVCFLGREEDVIVCNLVFEYALDCINSKVNAYKNDYRKRGLSVRGLENTYALGFVRGLEKSFEKQKAENQAWGLVLVKPKEVTDAFSNMSFRKQEQSTGIITNNDATVYNEAKKDGLNFSISDKIANEGEELLLC